MKTHLDEIIQRWREGSLNEGELCRLNEALTTPEGRAAVRGDWFLEASLAEALRMSRLVKAAEPPVIRRGWMKWFTFRPLTAAAAGLAFGMLCTSLVRAVSGPRPPVWRTQALPLANADFEDGAPLLPEGVPDQCGAWSGDFAESATGTREVPPKRGERMFRFLRSHSSLVSDAPHSHTGNLYQAVDMRPYRNSLVDGLTRLDWSAWFHWVPGKEEEGMSFAVNVWTFSGSPSILPSNWRDHLYRETAKSGSRASFHESPCEWRELKGSMIVPPDTDFLVIELKAIPPVQAQAKEPYRFPGCYADDVRLVLHSSDSPASPAFSQK